MNRQNINKIAQTTEDRLLLAKVWDKILAGMDRNIPANSCFLSPREQEMVQYLFGDQEGLSFFGGYPDAERRMLVYLPDYMDGFDFALRCLRAEFYAQDTLTHRDFLGALMGLGIGRETVGDICVDAGCCDFFVADEIAPFLLENMTSAGRVRLKVREIPLEEAHIPHPETTQIRDTVASLRLDSILSSGFRISRSAAAQYIQAGKAALDGLPCEKPDKLLEEGQRVSVRGLGKIQLTTVNGLTKKGRISVVIDRYV